MKITPIAVATIVPAVIAGAAFSAVPFAQAAAAPAAAHTTARHVTHVAAPQDKAHKAVHDAVRKAARHHHRHHAHAATAVSTGTSASQQQSAASASIGQQSAATSGPAVTAGESSFEQCVAWRESGDTPTDPDGLFGILPSTWAELGYSGTAGQASVAQQDVAFQRLYAEYGAQPWAPSDGC